MKRKTNKAKEEAWSQTAHAPDGEQPGPEASDTSGQSVPKSKFRKKSQQEQAAAAKLRMESQGEKLEQAREKLAKQKPPKKPGPVKRIGRVASGSVHSFVHGKIFEVEQENVGTEGAHRSELVGETALRHGSRFVRRKVREHPAKVVRKAEARYTKYTADYHFHTAAQEHPELTKNALTRYWQKQRLRRQYRKQAKEAAKQGAAAAGKTATATERLTARAVEFVKSHPAGAVVAVLCVLLLFAMQSCSSTMLMLGNAGAGALGASTYPCEDRDMLAAEAAYCALEDDLQHYLDTYESTHDYDEYHFDLDEIEHDPYVLLSLLCALHEGQWTIDEVQGTLQMLFDRQYILTEDVVVETRYRTETDTWTDEDGNSHTDTYQVRQRIEELSSRSEFAGWTFPGGEAKINEAENRLQLIFEEKPDADQRQELKSNGFKWAPSQGAWQRQLNQNAIRAAARIDFLRPEDGTSPYQLQPFVKRENKEMSR